MGTHPIFESDFDCLTENVKSNQSCAESNTLKSSEKARDIFDRNFQRTVETFTV